MLKAPPAYLKPYSAVSCTPVQTQDGKQGLAWIVQQKDNPLFGVIVSLDGLAKLVRSPATDADGVVGPDSDPKAEMMDLRGDGKKELVIQGLSSPHTRCVWVYTYLQGTFTFSGFLTGDSGIGIVQGTQGIVFAAHNRNLAGPAGSVATKKYVWSGQTFVVAP